MSGERIANKARKSISTFCMEECNAYCCRKGFLVMSEKEFNKVSGDKKEVVNALGRTTKLKNGTISMNLEGGCPSLKDNKCTIHKSSLRPKTCGDFPIYLKDKVAFFSPRCTAVKAGRLYPFMRALTQEGYKVTSDSPSMPIEIYTLKN